MSKVIRFPTEKCRLPGETAADHYLRRELRGLTESRIVEDPIVWSPPLLDELANGVQDFYPYP